MLGQTIFYHIKPLIPRRLQIALRRYLISKTKLRVDSNIWPIDERAGLKPQDLQVYSIGKSHIDLAWKWRKPITINNGGSSLTNFQIKMTVDTASLISAGKMNADGSDIRFTLPDGTRLCADVFRPEGAENVPVLLAWAKAQAGAPAGRAPAR
jgi:hypothetical protein